MQEMEGKTQQAILQASGLDLIGDETYGIMAVLAIWYLTLVKLFI